MDLSNLSSNWVKLQAELNQAKSAQAPNRNQSLKRKRDGLDPESRKTTPSHARSKKLAKDVKISMSEHKQSVAAVKQPTLPANGHSEPPITSGPLVVVNAGLSLNVDIGRYIAIDCEMVGVGPDPDGNSALARVSVVNYHGDQIYDSYVKPLEPVTDWRTHVSGILPKHMAQARRLDEVQAGVSNILQDRVLIGHAVRHDLEALLLSHPKRDIRDTARHSPYRKLAGGSSPRLKILASELLGLNIQVGEHSSVEDARACMMLFRRDKVGFEREHAKKWPGARLPPPANDEATAMKPKKSKKKKKKR